MGGKSSRDKGGRFERAVARLYREAGYVAERLGWQQSTGDGTMDVGVWNAEKTLQLPFHNECKHVETLNVFTAMTQAVDDSAKQELGYRPTVIHTKNHKPVLVTMLWEDWIELIQRLYPPDWRMPS